MHELKFARQWDMVYVTSSWEYILILISMRALCLPFIFHANESQNHSHYVYCVTQLLFQSGSYDFTTTAVAVAAASTAINNIIINQVLARIWIYICINFSGDSQYKFPAFEFLRTELMRNYIFCSHHVRSEIVSYHRGFWLASTNTNNNTGNDRNQRWNEFYALGIIKMELINFKHFPFRWQPCTTQCTIPSHARPCE